MRSTIQCLTIAALAAGHPVARAAEKPAEVHARHFVIPGADGRLVYEQDARGNRIPDFSYAGYLGGAALPPDVKAVSTVSPGEGDDGARIQAALDAAVPITLDLPMPVRGHCAVELEAGTYEIAGSLVMRHSGVVLRGKGTVILKATGTGRRPLIRLEVRRPASCVLRIHRIFQNAWQKCPCCRRVSDSGRWRNLLSPRGRLLIVQI